MARWLNNSTAEPKLLLVNSHGQPVNHLAMRWTSDLAFVVLQPSAKADAQLRVGFN